MKITFLSAFYPFRGGIAQFNANIFRVFEKKHEVKAYTFTRQYPHFLFPGETQFVTEDDQADPIPAIRILDTMNPFSYWKTARKIRRENPDVLVVRYWMTFFAPALGTVCKRMNKHTKRIAIVDNFIPHEKRFFDKTCNKYFVKHIDGYIVMSDSVLNDLLSVVPDAKYLRINHPLYDHFGEASTKEKACVSLGLNPDNKYLLFFGFIRDYKGLDVLLEALPDIDETLELIVAGEVYGSFEKYQNLIKELGLEQRVHLYNRYIPDTEVCEFFAAADVCVLPYKSATQSGITNISYHFELPVIATDVGGLKETIFHEKTGEIVPEVSSKAVAEAVNSYFLEGKKEKYIPAIREYKETHSWQNFVEQMEAFIHTLD